MNVNQLADTLEKANVNERSKRNALKAMKQASPVEISQAEQLLLQKGKEECELKGLCKLHLEAVRDRVEELKNSLEPGHPVHTLVSEHQKILDYTDNIEKIMRTIEKRELKENEKKLLQHSAQHLVEAEKHHDREEKTIFPRLEKKGVTGPPRILQMDHDELRERKQALLEASKNPNKNRERISKLSEFIVPNLREHIFKEDNILYPTALEKLEDWDKIKKECDDIGYCCFTPEK